MSVFKDSFWGGGKKARESWGRVGQVDFLLPALSYNLGVHHKKCVVGVNTCGIWWQREGQVWIDDGKARSGTTEVCCSHCCFRAVYCQTVLEAVTLRLGSWAPTTKLTGVFHSFVLQSNASVI